MFKSFANIFSSLGSIFKRSGKSSSASSTGVGGTNEKKSFIGKLVASLSTKNFTKGNMKNILFKLNFLRINKDIIFECNDIWLYFPFIQKI